MKEKGGGIEKDTKGKVVGSLLRILHIPEKDLPQLMKLWSLYALLSCGIEVAKLIAEVLFLSRAGIKWLPSLFVGQALVSTLAAVVYVALVKKWSNSSVFIGILVGFGVLMSTVSLGASWIEGTLAYGLVFGCAEAGSTLLKIHWGIHLLDIYNPKSASRIFPFLFTGAALGRSAGGAAVRQGAMLMGLPYILVVTIAFTLPLSLYLLISGKKSKKQRTKKVPNETESRDITCKTETTEKTEKILNVENIQNIQREEPIDGSAEKEQTKQKTVLKSELFEEENEHSLYCKKGDICLTTVKKRPLEYKTTTKSSVEEEDAFAKSPSEGLNETLEEISPGKIFHRGLIKRTHRAIQNIFASRLMKAMIVSTALMVLLRHLMRYGSLVVLQSSYDESSLAEILGSYSVIANLAGIGLQLVITPRLLKKFGVEGANLLYAGSVALGLGLLAFFYNVPAALGARFFHTEFKGAVRTPISPIFYFGEPPERRAEVRAFILGCIVPLFTIISGLILQALSESVSISVLAWSGTILGVVYVLSCEWQNRIYHHQLEKLTKRTKPQNT